MKKINLVSGPRNISTALMYSFAQRSDTTVFDEPFYAFYLLTTGIVHPGREEVIKAQPNSEIEVFEWIEKKSEKPVQFIKNMAHHMEVMEQRNLLMEMDNIFLIRNPKQIIASYSQVIEKPVMRDIGLEFQYELFKEIESKGKTPVVLDSGLLLTNPPSAFQKLCKAIDLPFEEQMLHWKPGPKTYDGVWATYWYKNVHQSTGFEKQPTSDRELRSDLLDLYEQAKHYYDLLLPYAIIP